MFQTPFMETKKHYFIPLGFLARNHACGSHTLKDDEERGGSVGPTLEAFLKMFPYQKQDFRQFSTAAAYFLWQASFRSPGSASRKKCNKPAEQITGEISRIQIPSTCPRITDGNLQRRGLGTCIFNIPCPDPMGLTVAMLRNH